MTNSNPNGSDASVAPLNLAAQLTSGVHLELCFEPELGLLRVQARASSEGLAFELDWLSLEFYMTSGLDLQSQGHAVQLAPMDIYEIGGLGWQLLMRHGIVPTEWLE